MAILKGVDKRQKALPSMAKPVPLSYALLMLTTAMGKHTCWFNSKKCREISNIVAKQETVRNARQLSEWSGPGAFIDHDIVETMAVMKSSRLIYQPMIHC